MKPIILAVLMGTSLFATAQTNETDRKQDLKINAFNLIVFKTLDLSYERILNPNSTVGLSVLSNLQSQPQHLFGDIDVPMPYYNEQFALTPFYRHYFMNRYAKGFFIEAFGMYNHQKRFTSSWHSDTYENYYEYRGRSNNFAMGIAVGGKLVSRRNFMFEFFGGLGRNLYESNPTVGSELVPRVGISLGYRL